MEKIMNFLKMAGKAWVGWKLLKIVFDFLVAGFLCWFLICYVDNVMVAVVIVALLLCVMRLWK
jgi:hypothetical protein